MVVRNHTSATILLGLLVLGASSARAQIAPYVDEHGKRVFVNAEEPTRRGGLSNPGTMPDSRNRTTVGRPGASRVVREARQEHKVKLERTAFEAAERHRVDPALVRAVIQAESNWNPWAVSHKGAQGLMQLVPGTAERFGVADVFNPEQNIDAGVRYLRSLLQRYNGDLTKSIAAYNAGVSAVDRFGGVPRYRETRNYVQKVIDSYFQPDSGRLPDWWNSSHPIYRVVDERGRVIFTNE